MAASKAQKQTADKDASTTASGAIQGLWKSYLDDTPTKLKTIDAFLVFIMLSGIIQFVYCVAVTNFPFNAFLAGFASTVGQFVLTASLRSQVNPLNAGVFKNISRERAFADFAMGSIVLHFFVYNFLG
ncbi:oligosaccharyltransferase complex subunit epsilon [Tulasnella sp. 424]|nr:oligosaccharyltransferase complex subunit epsilon [Tulasnella sp. 424]KAG8977041.1 oligosaccharyltransferase complex subunit epsilon [Tulasnella sp. 425]